MTKLSFIFFYLAFISLDVTAQDSSFKDFNLSLGSHTEFYRKVQTDQKGTQRTFDFNPMLGVGKSFPFHHLVSFEPEVLWVLPKSLGSSTNVIRQIFFFRPDFKLKLPFNFALRLGTSFAVLNQHGKGGKIKLNNGNTQTTFYNPDENRTSLNNTFDLGLQYQLLQNHSLKFQTYTYSLLKAERRQVSYSLLYTYHWDK